MYKENNPIPFIVNEEKKDSIIIPKLGKYCENNCGERLKGKIMTRTINGKKITYFRKSASDARFCSKYCKDRYFRKNYPHENKSSLACRIQLRKGSDGKPFRIVSIYIRQGLKYDVKIREGNSLWDMMERFTLTMLKKTDSQDIQQ